MARLADLRYAPLTLMGIVLILALVLGACTPNPETALISPNMPPEGAGEEFVPPTPTPMPDITTLSEEEIYAGLPEEIAALMPGDPQRGAELVQANGCTGCHSLDPNQTAVAPSWYNIANVAITRKEGMGPAAYLYESIVDPNAYVVEGYSAGIMPPNFGETLSPQDLADIVAYLLTLRGE